MRNLWNTLCGIIRDAEDAQDSLDAIEGLLCAAFESKHRHVVNTATALWNQAFANIEWAKCPLELKSVLRNVQSFVDIPLSGVDSTSRCPSPCGGQKHALFVASQDDLGALSLSTNDPVSLPARSLTPAAAREELSPATRSSARLSRSRSKGPKTKLRHDDSQIVFEPVESSPSRGQESQVLTDRQREVKERQAQAALFPEMGSGAADDGSVTTPKRAKQQTPSEKRYDYVASTPTPRRGQALHLLDDMDPDSSPPEPKRFPLMAELQARPRSGSVLNNWEFSSPVSGSPGPNQQVIPSSMPDDGAMDVDQPSTPTPRKKKAARKATPPSRRTLRSQRRETPSRSDDEFVDAPCSPLPPTPKEKKASAKSSKASSFAMSAGAERSMMRLVIQLDSKTHDADFKSPPKNESPAKVLDCIDVEVPSARDKKRKRGAVRGGGGKRRVVSEEDSTLSSLSSLSTPSTLSTQAGGVVRDSLLESREDREDKEDVGSEAAGSRGDSVCADVMDVDEKSREQEKAQGQEKAEEKESRAQAVMKLLRQGMDELRGAEMGRDEVYEVEDLLMDFKRELYEAHGRGRGRG